MKGKFLLYANCIPVKGFNRSIICDLQNSNLYLIPNDLYEILKKFNGNEISKVKSYFKHRFDNIIDEYFEFLISKDLMIFTNDIIRFPNINLHWMDPINITNCIIDISTITYPFLEVIIDQLDIIECKFIQIRFYRNCCIEELIKINQYLEKINSAILSLELIIPFSEEFIKDRMEDLQFKYPRITSLIIYNSPNESSCAKNNSIVFIKKSISAHYYCGVINSNYFSINIKNFTESLNHNSCLNRKISIDVNGNIKNCPSMSQSFGNIKDITLQEALDHPDFKKYWNITKDQIDVCKDCEFRYVCTDCRAYIENPEDQYSKPLKCGYNPYTNEWEEWSTNPLKQKAIEYYGMQDLVKKDV